jgi:hypothetical protein
MSLTRHRVSSTLGKIMKTPQIDKLAEILSGTHKDSFFDEWERIKSYDIEVNRQFYERLDLWISSIPAGQKEIFERKISQVHHKRDRRRYRDWEKLFDTFNESFGFYILRDKYACEQIEFFEQDGKAPDLHATQGETHYYLECKTINHSQEERASWHNEDSNLPCIDGLPSTLEKKIKSVYQNAKTQLDAAPKHPEMKYLVTMVISIDHQISGFPDSEANMCLDYLNSIEDPKYFIEFLVH